MANVFLQISFYNFHIQHYYYQCYLNTILYVIKCDVLHFMKACKVKVMLFNVINKMNNNIPKKCGIKANVNNKMKNKIPKNGGNKYHVFTFCSLGFLAHPSPLIPRCAGTG